MQSDQESVPNLAVCASGLRFLLSHSLFVPIVTRSPKPHAFRAILLCDQIDANPGSGVR
jgi:hypothetical protein